MEAIRVQLANHANGGLFRAPAEGHLALLEPQRVQVVGALSVPFGGRPKKPAIGMIRELYPDRFHYMLYFQKPGLAEAEMAED
ncbi:MAG: alpha/beta hydrolase, partial [Halopseudomonas sp.]